MKSKCFTERDGILHSPCCQNTLVHCSSHKKRRSAQKRKRKSNQQLDLLMQEFQRRPFWSKEVMSELADRTGLSEAQVYKWGWDQKKKLQFQARSRAPFSCLSDIFNHIEMPKLDLHMKTSKLAYSHELGCDETLAPYEFDVHLLNIQRSYNRCIEDLFRCKPSSLRAILSDFSK